MVNSLFIVYKNKKTNQSSFGIPKSLSNNFKNGEKWLAEFPEEGKIILKKMEE